MKNTFLIKLICLSVSVCLILSLFVGCSVDDFTLYFGIDSMPKTLDPQIASSYSELLTVKNCFRGLMKLDKDGNAVTDLAEGYTVSSDKLTYTFTLSEAEWSNKDKVTADDFLYAYERAVMPETEAPHIKLLDNIESVKTDGERKVIITIKEIDENILTKLTDSIFMPCNRDYFNRCNGKYGLEKKYSIFNGKFTVSSWSNTYIILKRAVSGSDDLSEASRVYLTVSATGKNAVKRIVDGEVGIAIDKVNNPSSVDLTTYKIVTSYDTSYALVFNPNSDIGKNEGLQQAFAMSVHRELITIRMAERFKTVYTVIPEGCSIKSRSIKELELDNLSFLTEYDTDAARELYLKSQKELKSGKLSSFSVLCVNNDEIRNVLTNAINDWQGILGAYVNVETVSSDTSLLNSVAKGNYTCAFVPFSGDAENVLAILNSVNPTEYGEYYEKYVTSLSNAEAESIFKEASEKLSADNMIIPIISVPTSYIYDAAYKNVVFDEGTGLVDFSIICK